ncbi:hypothetical protein RND81_06G134800 [Saponaria officinalis]|uniref:SPARK domain-containing protein n=1 Tax=Saponaria officinalis TaxID=3572 RepID=A0AAW1K5L8_SAPOF
MRGVSLSNLPKFQLFSSFLVFYYISELHCTPLNYPGVSAPVDGGEDSLLPMSPEGAPQPLIPMSPEGGPQPLIPFLAPSPLTPFTNSTIPKLSGVCPFNFTAAQSIMGITSFDCFAAFAPFLANVICCPQLQATLSILIGQSSKDTSLLALNKTLATQCLSDVDQVLVSQGANDNLQQICKIHPSNLTEGSCPVKDVSEFETSVDTSKLLASCGKIDDVDECCTQTCQSAISEAAQNITAKNDDLANVPQLSVIAEDCKTVVQRWLASKLQPKDSKGLLRGLTNCNINKVCPLALPDTEHVAKKCGNVISNGTACCNALESYLSHLQNQSFITNLQAINCAAALGLKLQMGNVTTNVYSLCSVSLKKFSLQGNSFSLRRFSIQLQHFFSRERCLKD